MKSLAKQESTMTSIFLVALVLMSGVSIATAGDNVVEVYFVVEPQVIRNYQALGYDQATAVSTITSDIDYMVYEVNKMFATLSEFGLNIQVRAKKVDIMATTAVMFEDCILIREKELQADMAMEVFKEWLKSTDPGNSIGYDVALVWTGYDLFSTAGNNQVAGYATLGATCKENGVSVAEFDGTMMSATIVAHELAHSLGAPHLTYDPTSPCSSSFGFIMNPDASVSNENRWSFSSCTAEAISAYIDSLSSNCLTDTSTPVSDFQLSDVADADILDPEKICQRKKKDPNVYFGHYWNFYDSENPKGDPVCQKLMCCEKGTATCSQTMPSDGMACDADKRCDKGSCVASSIPTVGVDADCVFGDMESEVIGEVGMSCPEFVGSYLGYCQNWWVSVERCCATCKAEKLDIEGCEYGDRNPICKNYSPQLICGQNSEVCCYTCRNYVAKRSVRSGSDLILPDVSKGKTPPSPTVEDDVKTNKTGPPTIS